MKKHLNINILQGVLIIISTIFLFSFFLILNYSNYLPVVLKKSDLFEYVFQNRISTKLNNISESSINLLYDAPGQGTNFTYTQLIKFSIEYEKYFTKYNSSRNLMWVWLEDSCLNVKYYNKSNGEVELYQKLATLDTTYNGELIVNRNILGVNQDVFILNTQLEELWLNFHKRVRKIEHLKSIKETQYGFNENTTYKDSLRLLYSDIKSHQSIYNSRLYFCEYPIVLILDEDIDVLDSFYIDNVLNKTKMYNPLFLLFILLNAFIFFFYILKTKLSTLFAILAFIFVILLGKLSYAGLLNFDEVFFVIIISLLGLFSLWRWVPINNVFGKIGVLLIVFGALCLLNIIYDHFDHVYSFGVGKNSIIASWMLLASLYITSLSLFISKTPAELNREKEIRLRTTYNLMNSFTTISNHAAKRALDSLKKVQILSKLTKQENIYDLVFDIMYLNLVENNKFQYQIALSFENSNFKFENSDFVKRISFYNLINFYYLRNAFLLNYRIILDDIYEDNDQDMRIEIYEPLKRIFHNENIEMLPDFSIVVNKILKKQKPDDSNKNTFFEVELINNNLKLCYPAQETWLYHIFITYIFDEIMYNSFKHKTKKLIIYYEGGYLYFSAVSDSKILYIEVNEEWQKIEEPINQDSRKSYGLYGMFLIVKKLGGNHELFIRNLGNTLEFKFKLNIYEEI